MFDHVAHTTSHSLLAGILRAGLASGDVLVFRHVFHDYLFSLHTKRIAHLAFGRMNAGRIAASACKAARVVSHVSRSPLPDRSHCVHRVDIKQLSRCFSSKIPSRRLGDNSEASSGQSSAPETSTGLFMDRVRLTETGVVLLFIMLDPMLAKASL